MQQTLDRTITPTEAPTTAPPLTDAETDALLMQSASLERHAKVKAGQPIRGASGQLQPRAWSRGGMVD